MPGGPDNQVYLPPKLPPYLNKVYDLKPITGIPSDEEVIGIHAVIRVANKVVDVEDMGDPTLLAQLSEHLFSAHLARYRSKHATVVFPEDTTYTPPSLPVHVSIRLEPVKGTPSEEEIIRVQSAIRAYQQFANAPSLFDPHVDMELSQHLFDMQMARYAHRARECPAFSEPPKISNSAEQFVPRESTVPTNNAGTGAGVIEQRESGQRGCCVGLQDAMERSNRLAENANQLIEQSNRIAERVHQLVEQTAHPVEQSNKLAERFNQLFERLNGHLDQSNILAKESKEPVEKLGEVLGNINRVLVRIQHAIVRNHKGNTLRALDCLINEKGETPAISCTTQNRIFEDVSWTGEEFTVIIDGVPHESRINNYWLGEFVRFYGIDDGLFDNATTVEMEEGQMSTARVRLAEYLSSCLG
ncbi:unnamed protein product [Rhizoctonia solani]|uniref:Laminin domain protein n=1 Tax=Rhizoctonia solani TaxID=456999 RepID=A0A8H2XDT3_9AGAM|nr:unnamed protein product [Rhizoctonia solani]